MRYLDVKILTEVNRPVPEEQPATQPRVSLLRIAFPIFGPSILAQLSMGAVLPILAIHVRQLGGSVALAALVVSLLGIGRVFGALPSGWLVSHVGEQKALIAAATVEALSWVVARFVPGLVALAVATFVVGMTASLFNLARQSWISDNVPVSMRARALSTLGGMGRIGLFLGPFVGSGAVHLFGIRAAFVVGIVGAVASTTVLIATRRLTAAHDEAELAGPRTPVFTVLRQYRHTFATLGVGVLAISSARACRNSLLPLWSDHIGLSPAKASLVFGITGAVEMFLFYPAGSVMDRLGRVYVAVPVTLTLGAGMLLMPLTHSFPGLAAVGVLMAIGNGLGSGIVMTLGADAAPPDARPQFLGGWRVCSEIGTSGGPLLISAIAAAASLGPAALVLGAITLVGGAWLARWVPRFEPDRRPASA